MAILMLRLGKLRPGKRSDLSEVLQSQQQSLDLNPESPLLTPGQIRTVRAAEVPEDPWTFFHNKKELAFLRVEQEEFDVSIFPIIG